MTATIKILLFIAAALAAGVGYYLGYDRGFEQAVEETGSATSTAETHEDLPPQDGADWARYTNSEFGFQIEYRTNPDGYILEEPKIDVSASENLRKVLVLMHTDEYEDLQQSTEPREWPPAITISVFENLEGLDAATWVRSEPALSYYQPDQSALADIEVAGEQAVRYSAPGLYQTDNVAVMHGDYMYLLSGAYLDPSAAIRQDFKQLVETIEFLPETP